MGSDEGKIVEVEDDFDNSDDEEERKDDGRAPQILLPNLSEEEEVVHWSMLDGNKLNKDQLLVKMDEQKARESARAKKEQAQL